MYRIYILFYQKNKNKWVPVYILSLWKSLKILIPHTWHWSIKNACNSRSIIPSRIYCSLSRLYPVSRSQTPSYWKLWTTQTQALSSVNMSRGFYPPEFFFHEYKLISFSCFLVCTTQKLWHTLLWNMIVLQTYSL